VAAATLPSVSPAGSNIGMEPDLSWELSGRLTASGHELLQRVYFEDTDFSGRVYHARYLHFLERGRSDYLRLHGIRHRELAEKGLGFAVSRMEIEFLRPASIDDVLTVRTATQETGGARIVLRQEIFRGDERLVAAAVTVALIGPTGRALRLPPDIRAALDFVDK
jgi:acyl-CoA thioester hydrolase